MRKADLPAIAFACKRSPLSIIDNGHTIQVSYTPGSFITVGGRRYVYPMNARPVQPLNGERFRRAGVLHARGGIAGLRAY